MESIGYYIFCIIAAVVCFLLIKKLTGCMIKMLVAFIAAAIIAAIYFLYFK
jgi:tetrahydromethanopterin S-methyltransferase subunit E